VLREMARVCRTQGKVAVEDLVSSEHRARADYQNQFERLRDPSHTRTLAASELLALFTAAGLEIERLYSGEIVQNLERWLANSQTPPDRAAQVRALIERDARDDLSGTRPYFEDGQWFFRHQPWQWWLGDLAGHSTSGAPSPGNSSKVESQVSGCWAISAGVCARPRFTFSDSVRLNNLESSLTFATSLSMT